jgi:hypothetical protein
MTQKWQPCITDVIQPLPTDKLLDKAVYGLYRKHVIMNPLEVLHDEHGRYGFRYPSFILVAKRELYGNIVSVHEEAILKARAHRIGIVMYLHSAQKYYWFNPVEIDYMGERNLKGKAIMVNFSIKYGKEPGWGKL